MRNCTFNIIRTRVSSTNCPQSALSVEVAKNVKGIARNWVNELKAFKGTLWRRTMLGLAYSLYRSMKQSSRLRRHEFDLDKQTFTLWLLDQPNFNELFGNWEQSYHSNKLKPSVDRLDNSIGYRYDNMRLITWEENVKLG